MNHHYLVREIILKYHRGEPLTAAEQTILDAEIAKLPSDKVWERVRSHIESRREEAVIRPWYSRWPAVTAGAAAVIVLIAGGVYRYQARPNRTLAMQPVWRTVAPGHYHEDGAVIIDSAGAGQSNPYRVNLPDGTTVTLSYGSSVRYAKAFGERKVILAGQAHFDVAKNVHPFIVESGKTSVEVLGTQFNWMHYPGVPDEITLLSGKIRLARGNFQQDLVPAERAVIREGNPVRVSVRKMARPEEAVAWMGARRTIVFDSTDLDVVIQRMAQYYQVGYSIDPGLKTGRLVTGIVNLEWSLEENLKPVREILKEDASVNITNGMIKIEVKK
jgi:hypothetical protein